MLLEDGHGYRQFLVPWKMSVLHEATVFLPTEMNTRYFLHNFDIKIHAYEYKYIFLSTACSY